VQILAASFQNTPQPDIGEFVTITAINAAPPRVLPIDTGHNVRDLGGYPSSEGRTVRWRHLFRSGVMSRVAGEDVAALRALGIASICDFRTNDERVRRPTVWHEHEGSPTELYARDYDFSGGSLFTLFESGTLTAPEMHDTMIGVYRELPFEQAEAYRAMFTRIAAGQVPLLFNCSAGKDRTGVAAALLLHMLEVPHHIITQDYLETNIFLEKLASFMATEPKYKLLVESQYEVALPLLRAEAEYLEAAFAAITARHGTVAAYFADELGISPADQDNIRARLLE
jgi:protein-tyrosine phosphatase